MWFTVLHEEAPIGVVDLPATELAAGTMQRLPRYTSIRPAVQAATIALLKLGLFGAAFPPVAPAHREILGLRRALARAARLKLSLVDEQGSSAQVAFVNLLEAPADERVVVVVAFEDAIAAVAAMLPPTRDSDAGSA